MTLAGASSELWMYIVLPSEIRPFIVAIVVSDDHFRSQDVQQDRDSARGKLPETRLD